MDYLLMQLYKLKRKITRQANKSLLRKLTEIYKMTFEKLMIDYKTQHVQAYKQTGRRRRQ